MNIIPETGKTYKQGAYCLTVIMVRDDYALLAQHENGKLVQYVIAHNFDMIGEDLYWRGNGKYYLCSPPWDDSPYSAFLKAVDALRERVYAVIADTDEGAWCEVCSTYESALYHLGVALNANASMVALAEKLGCAPLTAESYIENKHRFDDHSDDYYCIDIDEIMHDTE